MRLLRDRADFRGLFEALAADAPNDLEWALRFREAGQQVFNTPDVAASG